MCIRRAKAVLVHVKETYQIRATYSSQPALVDATRDSFIVRTFCVSLWDPDLIRASVSLTYIWMYEREQKVTAVLAHFLGGIVLQASRIVFVVLPLISEMPYRFQENHINEPHN